MGGQQVTRGGCGDPRGCCGAPDKDAGTPFNGAEHTKAAGGVFDGFLPHKSGINNFWKAFTSRIKPSHKVSGPAHYSHLSLGA